MKIQILTDVPVPQDIKPKIGETYEVIEKEFRGRHMVYFINVNGARVGILGRECKVIEEADNG